MAVATINLAFEDDFVKQIDLIANKNYRNYMPTVKVWQQKIIFQKKM